MRVLPLVVALILPGTSLAQTPTPEPTPEPLPTTIAVVAPPPGTASSPAPLYDVEPTITIEYSSDPKNPLDLESLSVLVGGQDWSGKFAKLPNQASYAVTRQDALVAGTLPIMASISDTSGATVQTVAWYNVYPTFLALIPNAGELDDPIKISARGLSPNPGQNILKLSPAGIQTTLLSVDRENEVGTFRVPPGTMTGPVSLDVNLMPAADKPVFRVPGPLPACGLLYDFAPMHDGWLAHYQHSRYDTRPVDAGCPPVSSSYDLGFALWVPTSGPPQVVAHHRLPSVSSLRIRIAVDKTEMQPAVIHQYAYDVQGPTTIQYKGVVTNLVPCGINPSPHIGFLLAADFSADGDLYAAASGIRLNGAYYRWAIIRIPSSVLASGGDYTPQIVTGDLSEPADTNIWAFVVDCDGYAYLTVNQSLDDYPWVTGRVLKVHLESGAEVAAAGTEIGEQIIPLAQNCQAGDLWAASYPNVQTSREFVVWRYDASGTGIGAREAMVSGVSSGAQSIAFSSSGNLYYATSGGAILLMRQAVEPCDWCQSAAPQCPQGLKILPETTRWRPQRAKETEAPINVFFAGPKDLDLDTIVLEAATGGLSGYQPRLVSREKVEDIASNAKYKVVWDGDWTYGDPPLPLPRGEYELVVKARRQGRAEELKSEPYGRVSLVEVTSIEIMACPPPDIGASVHCTESGATLAPNQRSDGALMPGGGWAVHPDASVPGGGFRQMLLVTAKTEPSIEKAAGSVTVFFRAIDVDDPSAGIDARGLPEKHPVDDDSGGSPFDNRDAAGGGITPSAATQPDSGGLAFAQLRAGVRQGDNYRVVASTSAPWLEGIRPVVPSTWGEVKHGSGEPLQEKQQVSEMLTVWRTLHVELDRMDPDAAGVTQDTLDREGTWTKIGRALWTMPPFADGRVLEDDAAQFIEVPTRPDERVEHPKEDDWKGGVVDPFANGGLDCDEGCMTPPCSFPVPPCYRVTGNSATRLVVGSGNLKDEANPDDRRYVLRDDLLRSLTDARHDLSLLRQVLDDVYVRVGESTSPQPLVIWDQYFGKKELERLVSLGNSDAYWKVPLILGFEESVSTDHDPTNERPSGKAHSGPVAGRAAGGYHPLAVVYAESIRDFLTTATSCIAPTISLSEFLTATQAHELLHTLALQDEGDTTGGLMCATIKNYADQPGRGRITEGQKATLRGIEEPWAGYMNSPGCPEPPSCQ